ncbi:SusD/RagB family nutrient-binding outer membrane lipoprotein [Chitinophaga qingshengii]|uniref:SusD/RagB family nutrient-binding outer membrane lipoprotein n=1 Tax=Chitinophaga qingshengii TaxID=1569794 RepID=A0ABR7TWW6_9BACT|nr:SusD/RagB family nutrient-binding outer membrane lipoprotein [Chitinophaga qingshengii]MBC9934575.1 SusD/RagB family nutrient-binding outer membrane lipoprotein [Chitinophaga qingshengii]
MTILNKTLVSAGLAALLALGSGCKKYLDVNENRDSPLDAPPAAILTGAQVTTGFVLGGADVALTASLLTNQVDGTSQQFKNYQLYQIVADNLTNCWGSIYQGVLNDLVELRKKSDAQKWYFFSGASKIMTAYVLGATTDLWGDIPYSDGFKGLDFKFQAKYDKQEDIYKAIDGLLTAGIADLQQPQLGLMPGDNDVMYSGSTKLWIKFANSYRLRTLIHLTKKDPAGYAQKVIDAAGAAGGIITKPEEIAQIYFLADPTRANPIQQFNDQRPGYVTYGESAMFEAMNALGDPRVDPYLGGAYDSKNSPVYLITDYEVNFILAEAHARLGHDADAQKYYEAGVLGSFASVKTDPGDYLTKPEVKYNPNASAEDKLKLIMTQKYYAMYLQAENFTDWRRTGYPVLTSKNPGKEIPRRYPYPQSELSYNKSNVPTGISLTSKMWWDQ